MDPGPDQGRGAGPASPHDRTEELKVELRKLTSLSTPAAVRRAEVPRLRELSAGDLGGFLDRSIAAMDDTKYRHAAAALLAGGSARWQTLEVRGRNAAEALGLNSYDAFRKPRRSTETSHLEETLELLAEAIVADAAVDAAAVVAPVAKPHPNRRAVVLVASAVGLVLVALAATVTLGGKGDRGRAQGAGRKAVPAKSSPKPCPTNVGELPAGADEQLSQFIAPFRSVAAVQAKGLCAAGPIERWGGLVEEHFTRGSVDAGALVASAPDRVLLLTAAEYLSYFQIGGKGGTRAQAIEGLPISLATDGRATIVVTTNGGVVSEGRDQPGYFLGDVVWTTWKAGGGATSQYGLPTSNPLFDASGLVQDFEHGTFVLPFNGTLRWQPVADAASALPPDPTRHILRHNDGTTWYVGTDSTRHWIPDGGTYQCLAQVSTMIDGVPGYATATLRLGAPATCRLAE